MVGVNPMSTSDKTILVVDDEISDREMMRDLLRKEGYHVITATDGLTAKRLYQDTPIDMLVTDVAMTPVDGCDLAKSLSKSHPDLKVMFVSGYTGAEILRQRSVSGVDAIFLKKPFTPEGLIFQVREFLGSSDNGVTFAALRHGA